MDIFLSPSFITSSQTFHHINHICLKITMYTQGRETTFASLQWLVKLAGNGKAIKKTSKEFILGSKMAGLRKLIVLFVWSQKNFACFHKHFRLRLVKVEQALVNNRSLQNNSWRPSTFSPAWLPCPAFLKTAACLGWELVRLHWVFLSFLSLYNSFLSLFEMSKYGQNDIIMENCQILGFNKTDSVSSSCFSSFKPPHHFLLLVLDKAVCVSHLGGHTLLPGWTLQFPPSHTLCRARPSLS